MTIIYLVSKPKENETQVEADVHQAKPVEPTKPAEVVAVVEPCGDCTKPCTPCVEPEAQAGIGIFQMNLSVELIYNDIFFDKNNNIPTIRND